MKTKAILMLAACIVMVFGHQAHCQEQCPCFETGSNGAQGQIDAIGMAAFNHTSAPSSPSGATVLDVASTSTATGQNFLSNIISSFQILPSGDASSKVYFNEFNTTLVPSTSANGIGTVIGHASQIDDWGSGNLREAYPQSSIFNKHASNHTSVSVGLNTAVNNNSQTGTIDSAFGVDSWVTTGAANAAQIGVATGGRFVVDTLGLSPGGFDTGAGAHIGTAYGLYAQIQNNPPATIDTAYGYYSVLNNGAALNSIQNFYGFFVDTPILVDGGNVGANHTYGIYVADQSVHNGANNPDPWGIYVAGLTKNNLGAGVTSVGTLTIDNPGSAASNKAVCFKSDSKTLGYCSTAIGSNGSCTCN